MPPLKSYEDISSIVLFMIIGMYKLSLGDAEAEPPVEFVQHAAALMEADNPAAMETIIRAWEAKLNT